MVVGWDLWNQIVKGSKAQLVLATPLLGCLKICTKLAVNINNIIWPSGGGECAGAHAGGIKNNQGVAYSSIILSLS
eukprot:6335780-Ditylum_brightwellii.AAC.1